MARLVCWMVVLFVVLVRLGETVQRQACGVALEHAVWLPVPGSQRPWPRCGVCLRLDVKLGAWLRSRPGPVHLRIFRQRNVFWVSKTKDVRRRIRRKEEDRKGGRADPAEYPCFVLPAGGGVGDEKYCMEIISSLGTWGHVPRELACAFGTGKCLVVRYVLVSHP